MPQASRHLIYPSALGTIIFGNRVIETFKKFQQSDDTKLEAGGQLFAALNEGRIDVLHATVPGEKAARGRYFFRPNRRKEQQEIKAAFKKKLHFVGDWHTHPEPLPSPSSSDVEKASEIFRRSEHELNALLMVIMGTAGFPRGLCVAWVKAAEITVMETNIGISLPDKRDP